MSLQPERPVVIGRDAELSTVRQLVSALGRGEGAALLVTGEAGIGKSRLVAEIAALVSDAGGVDLAGRSVKGGGTFRAVAEALAPPLRDRRVLESEGLSRFRNLLGMLIAGDPETGSLEPDEASSALAGDVTVAVGEAVIALLRELDHGAGCVIVLDDLHWADAATLALATYLASAAKDAHLLLVLAARDEESSPWPARFAAQTDVTTLRLGRLEASEVAELAAHCRGGSSLSPAELATLVDRSEGVPLLVRELVDRGESAGRVPPTFAALVGERLDSLAEQSRNVVMCASVLASDPDWRLLVPTSQADQSTVLDALRRATEVGLLSIDNGVLRWRHALTRDAVLARMSPPEGAVVAIRAADALIERGEARDRSSAAELLLTAGERQRAADILVELARRDSARGALRSADELLAKAAGTGRSIGAVAAERVQVLAMLGRVESAIELGEEALGDGEVVGVEHAELCLRLARAAVQGGQWRLAEDYLARANVPTEPRAVVLAADAAFGVGDVDRAFELTSQVMGTDDARPSTRCEALMVRARCELGADLAPAADSYRSAAQLAAEHALVPWRIEALFGLGSIEFTAGDPRSPALEQSRALATNAGMLARAVQADLLLSEGVLLVEGPRAALPLAQHAAERAGRLQHPALQSMAEMMAATDAALSHERALMSELLAAAASRADAPTEVATMDPVVRGLVPLLDHDLPQAAGLFDQGFSALLSHGSASPTPYFGLWALLRTAVSDRDDLARETLVRHHTLGNLTNSAALAYAEAIAAGRDGDRATAEARFAHADAAISHLPWWRRLLRLLALESAVADGWGDPVSALREDLAAHEQGGEAKLARTCRDLLRAAGAPVRRGRGMSTVSPALRSIGITSREADVLSLVSEGLTNSQIAARLYVSPRTAEGHVASLLSKTGLRSRVELRSWAAEHGAAPPSGRLR